MKSKIVLGTFGLFLLLGSFVGTAAAQDSIYAFGGDATMVSKYIWRGQRLTNDWSLQPSMTMGVGGFAFNAWGSMDLSSVNPGDKLVVTGAGSGLRGKFSEIDYTFSYDHSFEQASIGVGTIFYTFPERHSTLSTTTELYFSVSADSAPGAPSFTAYFDVDETRAGSGTAGIYFNVAAGHSVPINHPVFTGVDLSAYVGLANNGFGKFYYSNAHGGVHDTSFSIGLPITIDDNWSTGVFVTYSSLIGDYRKWQYGDPRVSGSGGTSMANTVWGGFNLSVSF